MSTALTETRRGELRIMDREKGDAKIEWDKTKAVEVEVARKAFDAAKEKGMAMFRVERFGRKGEQIFGFDPDAEKIIAIPPIVGG